MHIGFLNPQGNFDANDSYWTEHPDFGGQLVYVKEIALAMAALGHQVDIITRQIIDPKWPEFAEPFDYYPGHDNARIIRIPCGPPHFLAKEDLWPYLGAEWAAGIIRLYYGEGKFPHLFTTHYGDGGLVGAIIKKETGVPMTLTGHSLGAQKMDKLHVTPANLAEINRRYHFTERIIAERIAMNRAGRIITSTLQEQNEQYSHPAYHGAVDPLGADKNRFAVIPPGVNQRVFSQKTDEVDTLVADRINNALARDLPAPRRALPLVVCSSRLDRKKNHLGLVKAFAQNSSLQAIANLAIVVRGLDNPLQERHKLKEEERGILDEVAQVLDAANLWGAVTSFPLNNQAELAAAYRFAAQRHSVFALTALYEPFGLAPLEAMSCGLPAVVTRNGGPSDSLYDWDAKMEFGVLVDPADPADIARGLLKALSPTENWARYHLAGLERVNSRYTWARTAEGYLKAIEAVLAEAHVPEERPLLPIPLYFRQTGAEPIELAELAGYYFAGK